MLYFSQAQWHGIFRHRAFGIVEEFVLDEHGGVVVADGSFQELFSVVWCGGNYHLESRHMNEPCLQALGMLAGSPGPAAAGQPKNHGYFLFAAEIVVLGWLLLSL